MIWLAAHMWALLISAFLLGVGVGWWIWGLRNVTHEPPQGSAETMGSLDSDLEAT